MHEAVCPPRRMRYSLESRARIVSLILAGESPQAAAAACGASRATGYRLWRRYSEGGWSALADQPCTPGRQPRRLSREEEAQILHARHALKAGPLVIGAVLERPASTVGKVLRRRGCSRLPRPRRDPRVRYEWERPGELLHVDTKKLARFWEIGKRIRKTACDGRDGLVGSTCTSGSTWTAPGSPTARSSRASDASSLPPSCAARSPGMRSGGS